MSKILIVDVDDLKEHFAFRRRINDADISDIVWIKDGQELEFTKEFLDDWKYIGLSNISFPEAYNELFDI
jgi:hypothetical protein